MRKRMTVAAVAVLMAVAMCFSLTSCVGVAAAELSAGYSRTATEQGSESDELYRALAEFSFRLFGETFDKDGGNSLISPYSVAMCLGMFTEGAAGNTRAELEALLGMDSDALARGLFAMNSRICGKDTPLSIADSVWVREGFPVNADFLQRNADWYGADVFAAPFDNTTVNDINSWCGKNTDGMIKNIIDSIPADAVTYLINAVCFDAEWDEKYEKNSIRDDSFSNRDGSTSTVKMLRSEHESFLSSDSFRGFAKKYKGGKFGFVGLLPRDENTDIFEAAGQLDGSAWLDMWKSRTGGADAGVPEFSFEYSVRLNDALKALGVGDMFDAEKADFSGLSAEPTFCSEVGHKTFIELDRHGTRAAAITWGINKATAAMPEEDRTVILDRPFICMIVDSESGIPLFLGVISNLG